MGPELPRQGQARLPGQRDYALKACFACPLKKDVCKVSVVFHNQDHGIGRLDDIAVVNELVRQRQKRIKNARHRPSWLLFKGSFKATILCVGNVTRVDLRKIESESAPLPWA